MFSEFFLPKLEKFSVRWIGVGRLSKLLPFVTIVHSCWTYHVQLRPEKPSPCEKIPSNLVPRVSHLERAMRDPENEVGV